MKQRHRRKRISALAGTDVFMGHSVCSGAWMLAGWRYWKYGVRQSWKSGGRQR